VEVGEARVLVWTPTVPAFRRTCVENRVYPRILYSIVRNRPAYVNRPSAYVPNGKHLRYSAHHHPPLRQNIDEAASPAQSPARQAGLDLAPLCWATLHWLLSGVWWSRSTLGPPQVPITLSVS